MRTLSAAGQAAATNLTKRNEGFRGIIYPDKYGNWTAGYGRNFSQKGLTEAEAEYLLSNDMNEAESELITHLPPFLSLSEARKAVLIDMVVNMGMPRFLGFTDLRAALTAQDYAAASKAMQQSEWHTELPSRSERDMYIMETDQI